MHVHVYSVRVVLCGPSAELILQPEVPLPRSQEPITDPYSEPEQSSPHPHKLFLYCPL
jgi:hypothetical protein